MGMGSTIFTAAALTLGSGSQPTIISRCLLPDLEVEEKEHLRTSKLLGSDHPQVPKQHTLVSGGVKQAQPVHSVSVSVMVVDGPRQP